MSWWIGAGLLVLGVAIGAGVVFYLCRHAFGAPRW
jgi:hypothetical protein